MTASPRGQGAVSPGVGVVVGAPRRWLGLEGLVILAGALIAYSTLGQPWWLVPAVMLGIGYWQADRLLMPLALIWLAHIGLDRLLGMGLKYNDRFTHTHLGGRPDVR